MNEKFIKSNLTNIPEYPNRYTIEFRDLLIDYFGYIFPKPIIKKESRPVELSSSSINE